MSKLKRIDSLKKMIKSTINRKTDVVTTYKSIRKMSACVEKRGIFLGGGGCFQFGRGELG
jgi:hypothetical protein